MIKKRYLFISIIVFAVTFLGAIAYQQVAVLNVPQLPDDTNNTRETPMPSQIEKRTLFESSDKSLKLNFPEKWTLTENTPKNGQGTFGQIIQSVTISNYELSKVVSGGLPENAARIEVVISQGGMNKSIDELVDCSGKVLSCDNSEINGNQFKRVTHTLNTGNTIIQLGTKKQDTIYLFSALIGTGSEFNNNLTEIERFISSIEILK